MQEGPTVQNIYGRTHESIDGCARISLFVLPVFYHLQLTQRKTRSRDKGNAHISIYILYLIGTIYFPTVETITQFEASKYSSFESHKKISPTLQRKILLLEAFSELRFE